jgi:hypothetical protein
VYSIRQKVLKGLRQRFKIHGIAMINLNRLAGQFLPAFDPFVQHFDRNQAVKTML